MKIGVCNTYKKLGGAARAAERIKISMEEVGIETTGIYKDHDQWSGQRGLSFRSLFGKFSSRLIDSSLRRGAKASFFSESLFMDKYLINKINTSDMDVLNYHWVSNYFLPPQSLLKIKKPIIWTLHDMWPLTGGCHYSYECNVILMVAMIVNFKIISSTNI